MKNLHLILQNICYYYKMEGYIEHYVPFTFFFAFITYTIIDKFLNLYSYNLKNEKYYLIDNIMYKVNDSKIVKLKPLQCNKTLLNFNPLIFFN